MSVLEKIKKSGIIPVVTIERSDDAVELAKALMDGGLNCMEVTFRTELAADSIKNIKEKFPEMIIGAGTVLNVGQVVDAIKAGADFIVSPGSNENVIKYCKLNKIIIIPGVVTGSEIEKNLEFGIDVMKFFPAEQAGGLNYLKAIHGPYKDVRFMPTGGLNPTNVEAYLKTDFVIACGGSWMVKPDMIKQKQFNIISELAREAASLVEKVR